MKAYVRLILSVLILCCCLPASAVVFVSTTGNDGNTGLTWAQAKRTIQAGATLAASQIDLTVWVAKNTVLVPAYVENISVPVGVLIYGGFDGTEDPNTFDINTRVFTPATVVQPSVAATSIFTTLGTNRIDGFTIENGAAANGAAISMTNDTDLTVANCIIQDNTSSGDGAGIHGTGTTALYHMLRVDKCTFDQNSADPGGAIYADGLSVIITGPSVFSNNTAHLGGAIYAINGYLSVTDAAFTDNEAQDAIGEPNASGGAIYTLNSTLIVTDCQFTTNSAKVTVENSGIAKGGAIYAEGGTAVTVQRSTFDTCLATGNTIATHYAYGGAMYVSGVNVLIRTNMISDCAAEGAGDTETAYGGAIAFENPGIPNITNNTFYGNAVTPNAGLVSDTDRAYGLGAAVFLSGSGPANVLNNIISQSRGTAVVNDGMTVNFNYNLLWHNAGGDIFGFNFPFYSTNPLLNKDFNIMKDPQFYNKYAGDFHITYGSPAKNAGYTSAAGGVLDIDGEPRVTGGVVDIGADEFLDTDNDGGANIVDPAPLVFNLPDTDLDGISDIFDNCPVTANPTQVDSNGDGVGDACTPLSTGLIPLAYYVDGTVVSSGDGTTWATAFKTIQEAIDAADSHNQAGWTQNYAVWVRGGPAGQTYTENILIWHGVAVYGAWLGFPVAPTDLPSPYPLRDLNTHQTTINGGSVTSCAVIAHLPQDRYLAEPLKTAYDNTHPVLDSFRLISGDAELGGGVSIYKEFTDVSTCRINTNTAALGGGVYIYNSSAIVGDGLTPPPATLLSGDTTIYSNIATGVASYAGYGGGVYAEQGAPTLFANRIQGNTAFYGGGIAIRKSAPSIIESLIGCAIQPNAANGAGTGDGKGGGIYLDTSSDAAMNKLTIVSNAANGATGQGGGIYAADSNFTLKNSIVADNTAGHAVAAQKGGAIFASGTAPVTTDPWCWITYSDFWNNSVTQFVGLPDPTSVPPPTSGCTLTNLAVDPLFTDPTTCNYRLLPASPLIGAGDPADGSPNMGAFQEEDPPVSITEAKKLGNGVIVELSDVFVTAVFDDGFYVQSGDRTAGIKIRTYGATVSVGQMLHIIGVTTTNGIEREIMNPEITVLPSPAAEPKPLAVTNSALGGGGLGGQNGVWGWEARIGSDCKVIKEWKPACGLNNVGLLVKTWGRVQQIVSDSRPYILICDGSLTQVRVYLPNGAVPPNKGAFVVATGISTVAMDENGTAVRCIRARAAADLVYPQ
ncbi:MAG: right-handed parallel beta-helix repeat-containing protein [Armatimonadota bacterium]